MQSLKLLAILLLFISLPMQVSFAVKVIEPVERNINGGETINLGEIGPGQTISLRIDPKVNTGGRFGQGGDYDIASVVKLPTNWKGKDSSLYGKPLQLEITAAKDAEPGDYLTYVSIEDKNGEELRTINFIIKISITWDVLQTTIIPKTVSVGPSQPAPYEITIYNKGTASDVFEVSSSGLKKWQFKRYVYLPPKTSKTIVYQLVENEEENYEPVISVTSVASSLIKTQEKVGFEVRTNLKSDFKATNNGVILFPIFESAIYSLAGLISNFLG